MKTTGINRRHFMQGSSAVAGSSLLRMTVPMLAAAAGAASQAHAQGAAFKTLSSAEARELAAVAARILPSTETPGANEAGVIHFMDQVLGEQMAGMRQHVAPALAAFQAGITERFDGVATFSALSETDQDSWLQDNDSTPLFSMVYPLTLMGFFAMSKYGGNKDNVGWDLINFDGHGAAVPPFGYYDAEYRQENPNGD